MNKTEVSAPTLKSTKEGHFSNDKIEAPHLDYLLNDVSF